MNSKTKTDRLLEKLLADNNLRLFVDLTERPDNSSWSTVNFRFVPIDTNIGVLTTHRSLAVLIGKNDGRTDFLLHHDFTYTVPEFKYLPKKVVNDYFVRRGIECFDLAKGLTISES